MSTAVVQLFTPAMPPLKHCPLCVQDLPVVEFGIVRARKDGRNLYCKACIRTKSKTQREGRRDYKHEHQLALRRKREKEQRERESQAPPTAPDTPAALTPVQRVKLAIQGGARTQREIARETHLKADGVGDALAQLLLWTGEIRTKVVDNTRIYFPAEITAVVVEPKLSEVPAPAQQSLFQLVHARLGPKVKGISTNFHLVEKREAPAGLEPPACSRVA
jgi:hypothetical protein